MLETAIHERAGRDKANISGKDHFNKTIKNMGNKSFLCDAKILEGAVWLSTGCSVARLVARWLAVRQARVRISARHPMEVPHTEPTAVKKWRWASANVMNE